MTDAELDRTYTALCLALGDVGPERSELLLAMVACVELPRYRMHLSARCLPAAR